MSTNKQETFYNEPSVAYVEQSSVRKPRDYLIWSILNILFGNLIFGLIALFYSIKTRDNIRDQLIQGAQRTSKKALVFNIVGTLSMVIIWIIIIILIIIFRRRK
jgi:hypothetical protein